MPEPGRNGKLPSGILALLIGAVGLSVWEVLSRMQLISPIFFPPPTAIGAALAQDLANGQLLPHVRVTILRAVPALILGGVPAVILGLVLGWSVRLRVMTEPFIAAFHPIPKLALLPLFMVVVGIGETSKVLVAAVAAFFPMLINTVAGVRQISRIHFEAAESYGAGPIRILTRVVLPGSLPLILAGLRLAANIALVTIIAVEMISGGDGLGARVWLSWQVLRTEQLYATLFVISALGVGLNALLQMAESWLVPWQESPDDRL